MRFVLFPFFRFPFSSLYLFIPNPSNLLMVDSPIISNGMVGIPFVPNGKPNVYHYYFFFRLWFFVFYLLSCSLKPTPNFLLLAREKPLYLYPPLSFPFSLELLKLHQTSIPWLYCISNSKRWRYVIYKHRLRLAACFELFSFGFLF